MVRHEELDAELARYQQSHGGSVAVAAIAQSLQDLADVDHLWCPGDKGYESWLRDLAPSLLRCCTAPLLRPLAAAAGVRLPVASLLLPHALQELCSSVMASVGRSAVAGRNNGAATAAISAAAAQAAVRGPLAALAHQVQARVLAGNTDVRSTRALLGCLEFMRQTHRAALVTGV